MVPVGTSTKSKTLERAEPHETNVKSHQDHIQVKAQQQIEFLKKKKAAPPGEFEDTEGTDSTDGKQADSQRGRGTNVTSPKTCTVHWAVERRTELL